MSTDRIDFISAYCDRWCERCAFTTRCSLFAATCALAMCDDGHDAMELVFGKPREAHPDAQPPAPPTWLANLGSTEPTADEVERFSREDDARCKRLEETSIANTARAYSVLSSRWLQSMQDALAGSSDAVLNEACEVVAWDGSLLAAKLHRALEGRDCAGKDGDDPWDHPVQNDWNGSAKVALICIDRSEAAWRLLGGCMPGDTPAVLADQLSQLRTEVEREFPNARAFRRPGFDDPR